MLKYFFPREHKRYSSLPVLGSILNKFAKFIHKSGYKYNTVRLRLRAASVIDNQLKQLGCHSIKKITRTKLLACALVPRYAKNHVYAATIKLLESFFDKQKILSPAGPPSSQLEQEISDYCCYLQKTRGLTSATIQSHSNTILQFLIYLKGIHKFTNLQKLNPKDIEKFVRGIGPKIGRDTLQHKIGHLRSFLRFLLINNEISIRLDNQIDTPRIYREEKLPRSLPWDIVKALLQFIDRSTPMGKRDYAILLLIATYGLRASEVVSLKLDDINWRSNSLQISQHKNSSTILLPLTKDVGKSIINYLRKGRPSVCYREIFVRHKVPNGILQRTAINDIFQNWSKHSCLPIPFKGTHCLRHSYAIHLLRQGTSLKTIGDILGHRSFESTCVYLRLNIEDLRAVPLSLPN